MTESSAYFQLDERIQRFIWTEGWSELRDVQELAIPLILPADRDVIVAAATAAGKTEAAFFPALTHILRGVVPGLIVYISPLKALINDQFGRLNRLCEELEVPVWPWHGDISSSVKQRFLRDPWGVLLITPESLEALLCNRGTTIAAAFERTIYFIIDELHAFIGSERGKQLQSLMHRIDNVIGRRIPRIGLSATLGDMRLAASFLRSESADQVAIIQTSSSGTSLKILVKGFEKVSSSEREHDLDNPDDEIVPKQIAMHLFKSLRGTNNLVFPNSRSAVEQYTYLLNKLCDQAKVPNEFWPHHGNLSKEIRADTEAALKQREHPATAVCTNTLELGIDIGAVKSVAQIGSPPSVASLRQRLGRSGRRKGESAILRGYCIEDALSDKVGLAALLRLDTVQTTAMISLLLEGWVEPPSPNGLHLSTLIQQLLSFIAQNGGADAMPAYRLLCDAQAPFSGLNKAGFAELLRHLGEQELLIQDSSGLLLHGRVGEKFVNHYTFYAAFASDEEFRIVAGSKTLGTLPVSHLLVSGQRILFAGRTWLVDEIDESQKTIFVTATKGGTPPLFQSSSGRIHTRVRQRMRELFESDGKVPYLDSTAQRFLDEGRKNYQQLGLTEKWILDQGQHAVLFTWLGDDANEAIVCLLLARNVRASPSRVGVEITKGDRSIDDLVNLLADIASDGTPTLDALLAQPQNLQRQKWDWALPPSLLRASYASLNLDIDAALAWATSHPL